MDNILSLPVSVGEAIDKLSILEIKCDNISDERKIETTKEYDMLLDKLKVYLFDYKSLYTSMKNINLIIWKQMDELRDGQLSGEEYSKLCRKCIETNDIRFRIKNKINLVTNSALKEQKGYKINRLMINLNCNRENFKLFVEPIRYLSYNYDELIINSPYDLILFSDTFYYDTTIKYNIIMDDVNKLIVFDKHEYDLNEVYNILEIDDESMKLFT